MKAILLAGGYGTRLFPLTLRVSKVMVPVAGKPVLEHLVRACASAGVEEVVISLNTNQGVIEKYFGDGSRFGTKIRYIYESTMSDEDKFGAIGAIEFAAKQAGITDGCIVINGDNVFYGLDLRRMDEHHAKHGGAATLALFTLADKRDVEQFSAVSVDANHRILKFQEKPKVSEAISNLASVGIYRLGDAVIREYLPAYVAEHKRLSKKPDRVGDLWQSFVEKMPLSGFAFSGVWGDTNTAKTYIDVHKQAMRFIVGKPPQQKCQCTHGDKVIIDPSANISPDALIRGPVIIEAGCTVEAGAIIGEGTHLMHGVTVGAGAMVTASIIFPRVSIGPDARIDEAVIDTGASIGRGCRVEQSSLGTVSG